MEACSCGWRAVVQLVLVRALLGLLGGAALAHGLAGLDWALAWGW